jgi:hypothetical protein
MKTLFSSINNKGFRTAIACFSLSAALFFGQSASAQSIASANNISSAPYEIDRFQASINPIENSLLMRVQIVNPDRKSVTISIIDSDKKVVYKKKMGRTPEFYGRFDISDMPDGKYTMMVQTPKKQFTNEFNIQTKKERIASAL